MAGMKFEYDENGAKFVYFLLSFYAMVIIPCTYYFWPRKHSKKLQEAEDLSCFEPCVQKVKLLNQNVPRQKMIQKITKFVLVLAWIVFVFLAYKASKIEIEHKEYDPFAILGVDRGATDKEIRKQYRDLSKKMHPDRGGDEEKFKELAKAYKALTDEEARKAWEEYGNPDGPGATQFGIALPKWIVDGKNSIFVLGAYVVVFMILMPTAVGLWWYKSIKYTGDQILMRTCQIYYFLIMKTPQIIIKRAIMILGSSYEFEKSSNPEIVERPSDNVEMPQLIKDLPDPIQEKIKELPFSYIYSIKARALIHAHLSRMPLPADTLSKDKNAVIKKCPFLINELVNTAALIMANANSQGGNFRGPTLETIENFMRLSPMVVQALWDKTKKHSLLQLPHLTENHLRHFVTKKRNICTIKQFVSMKDDDRRSVLRHLTNEQYEDIMRVCSSYPHVDINVKVKVFDDEDEHTITSGALVTVVVKLKRQNLEVLFDKEDEQLNEAGLEQGEESVEVETIGEKKVAAAVAKKPAGQKEKKAASKQSSKAKSGKEEAENDDDFDEAKANQSKDSDDETNSSSTNNEDYFEKFQQLQKRREKLETKAKISHRVYCPYFPETKQERWWLYIADRKQHKLISLPVYICTLRDTEELEMKFMAPEKQGNYTYSVMLRSDSYLDFDVIQTIKFGVQPAKKIEEHPQWNFTDDEGAKNGEEDEMDDEFKTESESENE